MGNKKMPGAEETQKLGLGMITAACLLLLGLLYIFFDNIIKEKNNPNRHLTFENTTGKSELVLKRNHSGHYIAPGTINGKPVSFLLDTGATLVSVPAHQASRLGLVPGRHGKARTANGIVNIRMTTIESLTIGPFHLREIQGFLNPGMNSNDNILLGMSVLKKLQLIQQGKYLTLRPVMIDQ